MFFLLGERKKKKNKEKNSLARQKKKIKKLDSRPSRAGCTPGSSRRPPRPGPRRPRSARTGSRSCTRRRCGRGWQGARRSRRRRTCRRLFFFSVCFRFFFRFFLMNDEVRCCCFTLFSFQMREKGNQTHIFRRLGRWLVLFGTCMGEFEDGDEAVLRGGENRRRSRSKENEWGRAAEEMMPCSVRLLSALSLFFDSHRCLAACGTSRGRAGAPPS